MGKYYAVANGRSNGVYSNWNDCKSQVNGYSGARFKSFGSMEEARAFIANNNSSTSSSSSYSGSSHNGSSYGGSSYSGGSYGYGSSYSSSRSSGRGGRSYSGESQGRSNYGGSRSHSQKEVVYTDGSSLGNGRSGARAGWGVYWGEGDPRNASGKVSSGEQTNNRGELSAIQTAVDTISRDANSGKSYEVRADSQYARDALTKWGDRWESNGWKTSTGGDVKNRDLIESTRATLDKLQQEGVDVKITYVPGHAGHEGNEAADRLARSAASSS